MSEELLDIVNSEDRVIGKKLRSEIYREGLSNFRVVNAFVVNSKNELWIPRRAGHKKIFPLCLDVSMGGHVKSGEGYKEACHRELKEELNLDSRVVPLQILGKLTPHQHNVSAFMTVYEIHLEKAPEYNKHEFVEAFWIKPKILFRRIAEGDCTKDDLPQLVSIFYGH